VKLITVTLRPGHRVAFLECQRVWSEESRRTSAYLGEFVGEGKTDQVVVIAFWRSRAAYEKWMRTEHDRIATLASSEAHYESLEVHLIDRALPAVGS